MTLFTVMARCRAWYRRQRKPNNVVQMTAWKLAQHRRDDWCEEGAGGVRW